MVRDSDLDSDSTLSIGERLELGLVLELKVLGQKGTFHHMFWSCELLTGFWDSIIGILSLNMPIPKSACLCLLGTNNSDPWTKPIKKYIDLAFIAARKCITTHWKSDHPPRYTMQWWSTCTWYLYSSTSTFWYLSTRLVLELKVLGLGLGLDLYMDDLYSDLDSTDASVTWT